MNVEALLLELAAANAALDEMKRQLGNERISAWRSTYNATITGQYASETPDYFTTVDKAHEAAKAQANRAHGAVPVTDEADALRCGLEVVLDLQPGASDRDILRATVQAVTEREERRKARAEKA